MSEDEWLEFQKEKGLTDLDIFMNRFPVQDFMKPYGREIGFQILKNRDPIKSVEPEDPYADNPDFGAF